MGLLFSRGHQLLLGAVTHRPVGQRADAQVQAHRQQGNQRQLPAVDQHQAQGDHRHQPVDQRLDETGGQGTLDRLHRSHARGDIAQMALLEEIQRQAQGMGEHIAHPLQPQPRGQHHHRPAAQQADADLQQQRQAKAQAQHRQQVAVGRNQHLVHHPLHEERGQDHEHLQGDGQCQDLAQRRPQAADRPGQLAGRHRRDGLLRLELRSGRQLQGHAGEVVGHFGQRHLPLAKGRVEHRGLVLADLGQHHEMVEIPVQDARQLELAQILHVQPQRTGGEPQLLGDADQVVQPRTLERE